MTSPFDNEEELNKTGFTWRDIFGKDRWEAFTPTFGSLTVVGATTYYGRLRAVGRQVFFQVQFSAATSIASTAGTSNLTLPIVANSKSLAGEAIMVNLTTNIAVGNCVISPSSSACYLPSQVASGNTFAIAGWYEI